MTDTDDETVAYNPPPSNPAIKLTKHGIFVPGTSTGSVCHVFGPALKFNALIFGDLHATGGDTEDRLAVGGNATFVGGYSVGIGLYGNPLPTYSGGTTDMLIVGGDLHDGAWSVNGNIVYGGTRYGPARYLVDGNQLRHVNPVTLDENGNVPNDGSGATFDELHANMIARSAALGAMPARGVVAQERLPGAYGSLVLEGDDPDLNIFHVGADEWNMTNSELYITAPAGSTVLVNIHGGPIEIRNSSMFLSGVTGEKVLFNYIDATQITVASFTHSGSVLAPHASATLSGGSVEGRAVFGGDVTTSIGFEFHNYPFDGSVCENGAGDPPRVLYTFTVTNTGDVPLSGIMVTDPLIDVIGGPIALAPGATDSTTFTGVYVLTPADWTAGQVVNTASVSGKTSTGGTVGAQDTHVLALPETPDPDPGTNPNPDPDPDTTPVNSSERPDFAVQQMAFVGDAPTVTGEGFDVQVTVVNQGQIAGDGGMLYLFASRADGVGPDDITKADAKIAVGRLDAQGPGSTKQFTVRLCTPTQRGTHHVRAYVLSPETEWSTGDNQASIVCTINLIYMQISLVPGQGVKLTWNNYWGDTYTVYRASSVQGPYTALATGIPSARPAEVNTFLDTAPLSGSSFYKIGVSQ